MRDSAWRSFGRWMLEKDWAEQLDAPICKDKYNIFYERSSGCYPSLNCYHRKQSKSIVLIDRGLLRS